MEEVIIITKHGEDDYSVVCGITTADIEVINDAKGYSERGNKQNAINMLKELGL